MSMTIENVLCLIPNGTAVRIHIIDGNTIAGRTGIRATKNLLDRLPKYGDGSMLQVLCIRPLYHAHELYIECLPMLE